MTEQSIPTPREIGIILGMSLMEGQSPDVVEPGELALVQAAGLSHSDYVSERFILRASAAAHTAGACLQPHQHKDVAAGFMSWFEGNASTSQAFARAYELFKARLPLYIEAGRRDLQKGALASADELYFSQVSYTFSDVLAQLASNGASAKEACTLLSLTVCDAYWSAQVEGSLGLFKRAGMVK